MRRWSSKQRKSRIWGSAEHESAPSDLESLDEHGQRVYIEVKSTTSDDPNEPFDVSESELLFALQHRPRYYVDPVTDVHTTRPLIARYDPFGRLHDGTARLRLSGRRIFIFLTGEPQV